MSIDEETGLLSVRRVIVGAAWGVLLGLVVAISAGERHQASVELWLVFVAGWLAWMVIGDLMKLAPVILDEARRLKIPVPEDGHTTSDFPGVATREMLTYDID
ncbi:MAG: hypothetical protein GY724_02720, partial [Actinomycetia bacterium]|nr:hypothetical protein [Actinomycetes bacterium]